MSPPSLSSLRGQNLFDLTGVIAVVTGKFLHPARSSA